MKKTFLFCSLMLTALCLVGCGGTSTSPSESSDFCLFDLAGTGKVKSVKISHITNVTSKGDRTSKSRRHDDLLLNFNREGKLVAAYDLSLSYNNEIKIERDKKGNIHTLFFPEIKEGGEDNGIIWGGYDHIVFTWNKEGYPIREEWISSGYGGGNYANFKILYNNPITSSGETIQSRIIGKVQFCYDDGDGFDEVTLYKPIGWLWGSPVCNWDKRLIIKTTNTYDHFTLALEEREFTYYDENN
ncbi:MAG: hypothetical protein J6T80_07675 [Paludibacteraceae bacterium]|nr:hypothetical protein [Paludibacteraceae bacterium]